MIHTRKTLRTVPCPNCGQAHDGPLELHSRCHPEAPLKMVYADGIITVICAECEGPVSQFAVAEELVQ